mmetsp:Transcript_19632/g.55701  ORF Transcript_19632/g.55701 Transcript_19632/m.55701 type:complete len:246 (-) Transcript_19632:436-1173(-)
MASRCTPSARCGGGAPRREGRRSVGLPLAAYRGEQAAPLRPAHHRQGLPAGRAGGAGALRRRRLPQGRVLTVPALRADGARHRRAAGPAGGAGPRAGRDLRADDLRPGAGVPPMAVPRGAEARAGRPAGCRPPVARADLPGQPGGADAAVARGALRGPPEVRELLPAVRAAGTRDGVGLRSRLPHVHGAGVPVRVPSNFRLDVGFDRLLRHVNVPLPISCDRGVRRGGFPGLRRRQLPDSTREGR